MNENEAHKANDASSYLIEWLYDDVITWNSSRLLALMKTADFHLYSRKRDKSNDGLTDRQTDWPSYRDARRHLVNLTYLLGHLFARTHLKRKWKKPRRYWLLSHVAHLSVTTRGEEEQKGQNTKKANRKNLVAYAKDCLSSTFNLDSFVATGIYAKKKTERWTDGVTD